MRVPTGVNQNRPASQIETLKIFLVNRAPSSDFTPFRLLVNWRAKLAAGLKGGS